MLVFLYELYKMMSLDIDQQIFQSISNAKSILLVAPENYSGDCLASILAFYNYLTSQKDRDKIDFILPQKPKKIHSFLPKIKDGVLGAEHLRRLVFDIDVSKTKVEEIDYTEENKKLKIFLSSSPQELKPKDVMVYYANYYDLIITFNSPDLKSLGSLFEKHVDFFHQVPIINIDNQASNERFGQINFIDLGASSLSEQIFNLLFLNNKIIDKDIAECIFTGLVSATKGFTNKKLTPRILEIAGKLIDFGADREKIISNIYQTKSISLLKVWGQILSELHYDENYKIAWSELELEDNEENRLEADELIEELMSKAEQAEVIVLFQISGVKSLKTYIYSNYKHNSIGLVKGLINREEDFYGDGDLLNFEAEGNIEEIKNKVLEIIKNNIKSENI